MDKIEIDKERRVYGTGNVADCPHCEKEVKIKIIKGEYLFVKND